jgi:hypothetical protein
MKKKKVNMHQLEQQTLSAAFGGNQILENLKKAHSQGLFILAFQKLNWDCEEFFALINKLEKDENGYWHLDFDNPIHLKIYTLQNELSETFSFLNIAMNSFDETFLKELEENAKSAKLDYEEYKKQNPHLL